MNLRTNRCFILGTLLRVLTICVSVRAQPCSSGFEVIATCSTPTAVSYDSMQKILYAGCGGVGLISINRSIVAPVTTSNLCPSPIAISYDDVGMVYVACENDGIISINGSIVITLATTSQCPSPLGVLYDSARNILYATCYSGNVISISGSILATVATSAQCPYPTGISQDNVRGILYVTCGGGGVISISGSTVSTLATSDQCPSPAGVSYDNVHGVVYAACHEGGVISINGSTLTTLATSDECPSPSAVLYDSLRGAVYATCSLGGVIRITGLTVTASVSTLATYNQCPPSAIAYDSVQDVVYATCYNRGVISISGVILSTLATTARCTQPKDVTFDPVRGVVFSACYTGGVISISGLTVSTVPTFDQCWVYGVAYDITRDVLYAACSSGAISIKGSTVSTFPIAAQCENAHGVSYDSVGDVLYVSCSLGVVSIHGSEVSTVVGSDKCLDALDVSYDTSRSMLYVACETDGIISINGTLITTLASYNKCPSPRGVLYDSVRDILYATCSGGNVISISGSILSTIATSGQCPYPTGISQDNVRGILYVTCGGGGVISISGSTVSTLATSDQCPSPVGVSYDNVRGTLYVACGGGVLAIGTWSCSAGFEFGVDGVICTPCLPGTFRNAQPGHCSPCPAGSFTSQSGSIVCVPCPLGQYSSLNGSTACLPAPKGFYSDTLGSSTWSACPAGRYGSVIGGSSASCSGPCDAGYVCPAGSTSSTALECGAASVCCPTGSITPTVAPVGYYTEGGMSPTTRTNVQSCPLGCSCVNGISAPCGMGTFSNITGLSACHSCSPGLITIGINSTACVACEAGSYLPASALNCVLCSAGSYSNLTGATFCDPCPVGSYSARAGSVSCSLCTAGYVCPSGAANPMALECGAASVYCPVGSSNASSAPAGYYTIGSDNPATRTDIRPCPAGSACMSGIASACGVGTFSNMSGHSSCALCPSGFVTAQSNSTGCVACDAGSYLPVSGVECVPCPAGEFANTTASSECSPCPPGYVSSSKSGSFTCTACVAGTYSDGSTAAYQCLICAPGTYTLMNASTDCASCANVVGTFCEKGAVVIDTGYWGYVTSDNRIATAPCRASLCENGLIGRQCASGRQASATNALCGACDPGWSEWNGQCLDCSQGTNGGVVFLFVIVSWFFVFVIHVISQRKNESVLIGVFLYFVQTSLLIAGPDANWLQWLTWLSFTPQNMASSSTPCPASLSPYQHMALSILISLLFFVLLALTMFVHIAILLIAPRCFSSLHEFLTNALPRFTINPYIRTSVAMFLYSYSQVTTVVLQYLYCVDAGNGTKVMFSSPAIDCSSSTYYAWFLVVIVLLVVDVIGAPVVIGVFLWRRRDYFRVGVKPQVKANRFGTRWGVLFEPYRSQVYWWQIVVLLRRVVCVVLATYIITNLQWKMLGFSLLHLLTLLVELQLRPFGIAIDNQVEAVSLILLILLSSFLTANPPPYPQWLQVVICLLISVPVCIFVMCWIGVNVVMKWRGSSNTSTSAVPTNAVEETVVEIQTQVEVNRNSITTEGAY